MSKPSLNAYIYIFALKQYKLNKGNESTKFKSPGGSIFCYVQCTVCSVQILSCFWFKESVSLPPPPISTNFGGLFQQFWVCKSNSAVTNMKIIMCFIAEQVFLKYRKFNLNFKILFSHIALRILDSEHIQISITICKTRNKYFSFVVCSTEWENIFVSFVTMIV